MIDRIAFWQLCDQCLRPTNKEKRRLDKCQTLRSVLGADGPVVGCMMYKKLTKESK